VTAATAAQPNGSTTRTSFGGLNGIRAVGALLVLTTHVGFHSGAALNSTFNGLLSRMDVGVAIFFVISGFLLFRPHVVGWLLGTRRPGTRRYLKHRALRILPALWIAVVGAALLLPQESVPPSAFLRHATLTQIYSAGNAAQGLTQMWSLATEMAFYLLLPLLAWMVTRARPSTRSVLIALGILLITPLLGAAWMWVCAAGGGGLRALWLPGYLGWFGLGMALALWHTARSVGMLRRSWLDDAGSHPGSVWGLAGALYLVAASPVAGPYTLAPAAPGEAATKSLLYALIGALVVLPAVSPLAGDEDPIAVRRLGGRVGKFFGDISYGIFCYHLIVLGLFERAIDYTIFTGGFWDLFIPTIVGSTAAAALSFYFVERPIMRRGRRNESAPRPLARSSADDIAMRHDAKAATTRN